MSAFGPDAAGVAARFGDGLWTLADPESAPDLIEVYRRECEAAGKDPGEIILQTGFSWAPDDDAALEGARVWKATQPPEYLRAMSARARSWVGVRSPRGTGTGTGTGTATALSQTAQDYGQKITDAATAAKDYVSDKVSVVGDKFKELQNADLGELAENAKEYARQKPGQALLISAAAGLVLGLIIRGRR